MPGDGTGKRMWMRFRAQFFDSTKNRWTFVTRGGDSGWVLVGSARVKSQQAGQTFSFTPPPAGSSFTLRGVVNFQWRVKRRVSGKIRTVVVRRARANTKGGYKSVQGADPPGFSDGICVLH